MTVYGPGTVSAPGQSKKGAKVDGGLLALLQDVVDRSQHPGFRWSGDRLALQSRGQAYLGDRTPGGKLALFRRERLLLACQGSLVGDSRKECAILFAAALLLTRSSQDTTAVDLVFFEKFRKLARHFLSPEGRHDSTLLRPGQPSDSSGGQARLVPLSGLQSGISCIFGT